MTPGLRMSVCVPSEWDAFAIKIFVIRAILKTLFRRLPTERPGPCKRDAAHTHYTFSWNRYNGEPPDSW